MKILIPGGHITCALPVADALKRKGCEIVFVGRSIEHGGLSFEYKSIKDAGYRQISLSAGRFTRTWDIQSLKNIIRIPIGFIRAFFIVISENPDVILSFGGYIAVPLVFWGWLLRKKIYTHEQTLRPGLANTLIAPFCTKVFVTFEETRQFFTSSSVVISGNPIREELLTEAPTPSWLKKTDNKPLLLIMCGSLGSHSINIHIEHILDELLKTFVIVHQTGNVRSYNDHERLSTISHKGYFVCEHLRGVEMSYLYRNASIGVFRSGANTIYELLYFHLPSVLIPLPWSAHHEQQAQASYFDKHGVSKIFDQSLPSQKLFELINITYTHRNEMRKNFSSLLFRKNAATTIASAICGS